MQTYFAHQPGIGMTAAELDAALNRLRRLEESPRTPAAQWMRSYALHEADGRFGLASVFQAADVQVLRRHPALIDTPANNLLSVAATLPARPFAPTRVYLIRRRQFCSNATALHATAAVARRVADDMALEVSWLHSYVIREDSGTFGSVCFYQSIGRNALLTHAARAGVPADDIIPVVGCVVFRQSPQQQPTAADAASA